MNRRIDRPRSWRIKRRVAKRSANLRNEQRRIRVIQSELDELRVEMADHRAMMRRVAHSGCLRDQRDLTDEIAAKFGHWVVYGVQHADGTLTPNVR